ncbi:MAG: sporulation transcriptional regulator SpoIIID [Clostridia bacterium]|nr:sporulation transcriptional regulator SpoIIID [Clostridia bacterium]
MRNDIEKRILDISEYIKKTRCTIREAAKIFNVSKSTVHCDVSTRLKKYNLSLYNEVQNILQQNFLEKHIRGGQSTKLKYMLKMKQK